MRYIPCCATALARRILGPGKILAPEQAVVLSTDRETVLRRSRAHLQVYLQAPGPRAQEAVDELSKLLYPEVFGP